MRVDLGATRIAASGACSVRNPHGEDIQGHPRPGSGDRTGEAIESVLGAPAYSSRTAEHRRRKNQQVRTPGADGLAHRPGSVRRTPSRACGWRPSIWDDRYRPPRAVHPRIVGGPPIRAGPPAVTVRPFLTLLQVGFTEPRRSPAVLVVSCTTVSPLPLPRAAVSFLWHCPAGCPGWVLPTTLPCGARTFLDSRPVGRGPRSPGQPIRETRIGPARLGSCRTQVPRPRSP